MKRALPPRGVRPRRAGIVFGVTSHVSAQAFLTGQISHLSCFGPATLVCDGAPARELARAEGADFRQVRLPREPSPRTDCRALLELIRVFGDAHPAVSLLGTPKMALLGGIAALVTGVPHRVYVLHGLRLEGARGVRRRALWLVECVTCALATRVIAVGHTVAAAAIAAGVVRPAKIGVLGAGTPNGIDTTRFRPPSDEERRTARQRLRCPEGAPCIVFVGRVTGDKGIADLARAWPEVKRSLPEARLYVAGEVELSREVEAAARALLARDDVVALGSVDPRPLYWAADVLVLPTHREGLPTVVLEAAACGLPAVTTTATGARESVVDGVTGHLVAAGDSHALAAATARAIEEDARGCLGEAARSRVVALYLRSRVWAAWRTELIRLGVPEQ